MERMLEYIKLHDHHGDKSNDEVMYRGIEYFFNILKRLVASKSKFALLNGTLITSIYDIDDDNDENGFNHFFISLDNGSFYSQCKKLDVSYLYTNIRDDLKSVDDERKLRKIKPSQQSSKVELCEDGFKVAYFFSNEKFKTFKYKLLEVDKEFSDKITRAINMRVSMDRGRGITLSEDFTSLMETISKNPRTYDRTVKVGEVNVGYPFMKSFLFGLNKPEGLLSSISELDVSKLNSDTDTEAIIGEVYSYSIIGWKSKLVEIHTSYIVNYLNSNS